MLIAEATPWFTPTFIVATLGLIVSAVALVVNQQFTIWKDRQQELIKLFLRILADAREFYLANGDFASAKLQLERAKQKRRSIGIGRKPYGTTVERLEADEERASDEKDDVGRRIANSMLSLQSDQYALDLLLDVQAKPLVSVIQAFMETANRNRKQQLNKPEDEAQLDELAERIRQEINDLWKRYGRWTLQVE